MKIGSLRVFDTKLGLYEFKLDGLPYEVNVGEDGAVHQARRVDNVRRTDLLGRSQWHSRRVVLDRESRAFARISQAVRLIKAVKDGAWRQ